MIFERSFFFHKKKSCTIICIHVKNPKQRVAEFFIEEDFYCEKKYVFFLCCFSDNSDWRMR